MGTFMNAWLRLVLITMTVGGGFTGFALTLQSIIESRGDATITVVLLVIFLLVCAYVTVSGLIFVQKPQVTRPLIGALAIQIPWISSPPIVYHLGAGFSAVLGIGSSEHAEESFNIFWNCFLGTTWQFRLFSQASWRVSVNVIPLVLLIRQQLSRRPSPAR